MEEVWERVNAEVKRRLKRRRHRIVVAVCACVTLIAAVVVVVLWHMLSHGFVFTNWNNWWMGEYP